jgi:arginase
VLLALRRVGRYGLFFIDGHADFYQPEASLTGEVADMDLAIVTGRAPEILTHIENMGPLVKDQDVVAFGYRDADEQKRYGGQDIKATDIHSIELSESKNFGTNESFKTVLQKILNNGIDGFWIHLDADVFLMESEFTTGTVLNVDGGHALV